MRDINQLAKLIRLISVGRNQFPNLCGKRIRLSYLSYCAIVIELIQFLNNLIRKRDADGGCGSDGIGRSKIFAFDILKN